MSEQMRKEFERAAWKLVDGCDFTLHPDIPDRYFWSREQELYELWQAALATQPQAPQGAVTGWELIHTAPTDDLVLLSCVGWAPSELMGEPWPIKVGGFWGGRWNVFGASWRPTHWMPLPAAPETPEGKK